MGEGRPAHEFLEIHPGMSKEEVIERFGHPLDPPEYRSSGGVERMEYHVGIAESYSGGEVWGICTVVVRQGVVTSLEFSGSTDIKFYKDGKNVPVDK